ncbi:MAG: glycosyltransferase [Rhodospirillaceae bacterium]
MRIAVITPYHTESLEMLKRAHDSVAKQTYKCTHYMVADGHARSEIDSWDVRHIPLPIEHDNNGNTPRAIGSMDAIGDNFEAIAYLDADNWFDTDHIENLVDLHEESGADLVSSGRVIHAIDGTVLLPNGESGDGERHADTSAFIVFQSGFPVLPIWALMPDELGPNCDRIFYQAALRIGLKHAHSPKPTMHFTSRYGVHYRAAGLEVPLEATGMAGMKVSEDFMRRMTALGCKDIMSRRHVAETLNQLQARPITIIILGDESELREEDKKVVDDLERELGADAEFYFSSAEELENETEITKTRRNVFVLVFELMISNWARLDDIMEKRTELFFYYIRRPNSLASLEVTRPIDSRASLILVENKALFKKYHWENRYGAGHVMILNTITDMSDTLSSALIRAIHAFAK